MVVGGNKDPTNLDHIIQILTLLSLYQNIHIERTFPCPVHTKVPMKAIFFS